jgi:hypothetical protein
MADSSNTTRGAVGGAAAGAIIGGIIGNQSGEAGAGAALGAAAGAVAGGAYGNQKDRVAENRGEMRDSYGFTNDDYYNLMTSSERSILRERAGGRNDVSLMSYLTSEERANLRRRAGSRNGDIGR